MHTKNRQNIDDFFVVGVNYKKTDASIRGLFAINTDQYDAILAEAQLQGINNIFILSTCNRTEVYGLADSQNQLRNLICSVCGNEELFSTISYAKNGSPAIEHLFHVAAGLDSQILGDYEILGQIKNAVKHAKTRGFIGAFMERLINSVLQASKAIKTHTTLSSGTVSVSFAAVQYIKQYLESGIDDKAVPSDISGKKIVLLGTGKIGRSTCRNLVDYLKTTNITLINRTEETAVNLAKELNLRSAPLEALESELSEADIILISTNAPNPVIFKNHLEGKGAKLVVDLSVPCNVDAAAQTLHGITFVDVDMLSKIKDETLQNRKAEAPKAIAIINEHIAEFKEWYEMRRFVPVLKQVKNVLIGMYEQTALTQDSSLFYEQPEIDEEKIQKVINSLANKMRSKNTIGCHYIEAINDFIA